MAHGFDVFKSIDLIGVKKSDKNTFRFYSIEEVRWMAQRDVIINTTKIKLVVAHSRYKKQANKHRKDVQYKKRDKI